MRAHTLHTARPSTRLCPPYELRRQSRAFATLRHFPRQGNASGHAKERPPMTTTLRTLAWASYALAVAATMPPEARAQSVEPFYKGRSITILVGNSPGGINDISARLVARHLGRFVPGN